MQLVTWSELNKVEQSKILDRPVAVVNAGLRETVTEIISTVRAQGDEALCTYTTKFDQVSGKDFAVSAAELSAARAAVSSEARAAIELAANNIATFHRAQIKTPLHVETMPGVTCSRIAKAISRVGLYVPGGTAPLPSTVLMLGIPSQIAGCTRRVLCTPPRPDGSVDPHILYAAWVAGITEIFKVGGAQAIAAMAYGTATVPKVDKIFGPGNAYVTEAKLQVAMDGQGAMFDMPAGPSEVLVLADSSANPEFIAADLLSQAEHGPDSQVILLTDSLPLAKAVDRAVASQLQQLSRQEIASQALQHSALVVCDSLCEAIAISNRYGPEHLIIQTTDSRATSVAITSAGSVFIGPWTPESVGDYASGTNHVLPTYGYTKSISGLSLESFTVEITMQTLTADGLRRLGPTVSQLASIESLDAHRNAVELRLASLRQEPVN